MEAWLDEHPDFVQDYFLRCDICRNSHAWTFNEVSGRLFVGHVTHFSGVSF
jgi:hypothetical protein